MRADPASGRANAARAQIAGRAGLAGALATPSVIAVRQPLLAAVLFATVAVLFFVLVFMLVRTVVRGSTEQCERVFRLLPWVADRPEPPDRDPPAADDSR